MSASVSSGFTHGQGTSQGSSTGSSQGSSQGSSNSRSFIPQYDPQLGFLDQFGNTAGQLGAQQYGWAQDQFQNNSDLTDQNVNSYLQNSDMAGQAAQRDYANYNDTFNPAMGSLQSDAQSYASPERVNAEMGRSEAGVAQNFDAQRKNIESNLRSFGVNPSDPRYAGTMAANRTAQGASEAGAGTQARLATEQTGRELRSQVLQQANLLPGQSATEQNVAMQGNTGAQNAAMTNTSMGALTMGTAPAYLNSGIADVKFQPLGTNSSSQNTSQNNSQNNSQNSSQNTNDGQNSSQSQSQPGGGGNSGGKQPQQQQQGDGSGKGGSGTGGRNPNNGGHPINSSNTHVPNGGADPSVTGIPGSDGGATDEWGNPWSGYGDPTGSNGSNGQPDPFNSGYPGGTGPFQDFPNPGDDNFPSGDSGVTDPNAAPNWDPGWGSDPSTSSPDDTQWPDAPAQDYQTGIPMDQFDAQFTGGDFGGDGGGFAEGGAIPDDDQGGGMVPASMSPSGGAQTDDIPATIPQTGGQARLNANEFVIPQDVTKWFGHKFFQDLIMKARKANQQAPAHPSMSNGVQSHADGGEVINQQTHPEWYAANGAAHPGTPAWDQSMQQIKQENNARAQNIFHGTTWDVNNTQQTAGAAHMPAQIRAYRAANPNATPQQLQAVQKYYQQRSSFNPARQQASGGAGPTGGNDQGIPTGQPSYGSGPDQPQPGSGPDQPMFSMSGPTQQNRQSSAPPVPGMRMSTQQPQHRPSSLPTVANYRAGTAQGQFRPKQPYYSPAKPFSGSQASQPGPQWNAVHAPQPAAPSAPQPQQTPAPGAPGTSTPQTAPTPSRPAGMTALEAQYYDTGDSNWKFDAGAADRSGQMLFGSETRDGKVTSDAHTVGYNTPDPNAGGPGNISSNTVTPGLTMPTGANGGPNQSGPSSTSALQPGAGFSPGMSTGVGGLSSSNLARDPNWAAQTGQWSIGTTLRPGPTGSMAFKKGGAVPSKKPKAKKPARGIPEY